MAHEEDELSKKLNDYQSMSPKKALKESRKELKELKADFKTVKRLKVDKEKVDELRQKYHLQKRVFSHQIKRTGGTRKRKVAKRGYQTSRQVVESALSDQDILSDIVSTRRKIRHTHTSIEQSKRMAKYSRKIVTHTAQSGYGTVNRTYNLTRGKGFTRTPKGERLGDNLRRKANQKRARIARSQAVKASKASVKTMKWMAKPFLLILKNPLSLQAYVIGLIILLIMAIFMKNPTPMQQDEFALNDSWLYMSKLDREKSNEKVDYWTNIDDVMTYMNYRYEDYQLSGSWAKPLITGFSQGNTYKDALTSIWDGLNGDQNHLKTMKDLYSEKGKNAWLFLSKSDKEEYEEMLSESKEEGFYSDYQELSNPFYKEGDPSYSNPLVISKRFGYTSKNKIYNKSIFQAKSGQTLLAVMSGVATVQKDTLEIRTEDAVFTYEHIGGLRLKTGDNVTEGQEIGSVKDSNGQTVSYRKLEEKATKSEKAKWTFVNVGFYFPSVTYSQTTSIASELNLSGDLATKARAIKDQVKKKVPNATDVGIASMLGCFATESNVTAKRAEGDFLKPPIGASDSSWDDTAWLSIGGPAIYNGGYGNILHRGLGLGMWTDTADGANRHTLLLDYAKKHDKKWYDLSLQIDFMLDGDNPYYINHLKNIITSQDDVAVLTKRFLNNWEGNAGDKLMERQNNAKQILAVLKGGGPIGGGTMASSWNFPEEYKNKLKNPPSSASMTSQPGNGYPVGQCTWYAYNREVELGNFKDLSGSFGFLGNGQNWVSSLAAKGWKTSSVPTEGAVVSTLGGFDGTMGSYGHVSIVEVVNPDGSFLMSECNYNYVQDKVHYRVVRPAPYYTFARPK
ncbi:TPA: CHAP domain-containing protein [Streptococcus agalactiae]|nr:CHAP domain-containing protein [Streptococcus agalactiae]